jgi:hypothetical protein
MEQGLVVALAGILVATGANASGYRPPAHSELAYSFTCPSGASGHLRYVVDFAKERTPKLTLWVNGKYMQDDLLVATGLRGKNIEQLQATCEGDSTLIILRTFDSDAPSAIQQQWFQISVDRAGKVTSAGA